MPDPSGRPYLSEVVDQTTIETFADTADNNETKIRTTSGVPLQTTAALDLYVSAAGGSDSNSGLSTSAPLLTIAAVEALIPMHVRHVVTIHMAAGTYAIARSWWFRSRVISGDGRIVVYADDTWDPTVYTTRVTGTAGVGTSADQIVTSGLTLNAQRGYTLQMTSGDASGERRTIRNNSTTQLIPSVSFGAVDGATPASGNTFRVFSNAVIIAPTGGMCEVVQSDPVRTSMQDAIDSRYAFQGVTFASMGSVYRGGYIVAASTVFRGVRVEDSLRTEYAVLAAGDAEYMSPDDMVNGWGCTVTGSVNGLHGGRNEGCFVANAIAGHGWISSGYIATAFHSTDQELESMSYSSLWGNVSLLMGTLTLYMGHRIWIYYVDFVAGQAGPLITMYGSDLMMSGTNVGESTGGVTIAVRSGGKVHLLAAPTLGSATVPDYDDGSGARVNKSYFAAVGDRVHFDGSLIERSA